MQASLSKAPKGRFGIAGHAGCGPSNRHCGFVQDDSGGLAAVSATSGDLGPNEDIEGNVNLAGKAEMMSCLGLGALPTILVEGNVCASPVSPVIESLTFVTQAYIGDDNATVSECLVESADSLGLL